MYDPAGMLVGLVLMSADEEQAPPQRLQNPLVKEYTLNHN